MQVLYVKTTGDGTAMSPADVRGFPLRDPAFTDIRNGSVGQMVKKCLHCSDLMIFFRGAKIPSM